MHHHVTVVLAGATAHFMTGWILNSPILLGRIWKHEQNNKACGNASADMKINVALQIVASIGLAVATCIAIALFEKAQSPIAAKNAMEKLAHLFFNQDHSVKNFMNAFHTVLFIWAGFILPISAEEVIWCGHHWKHWALESLSHLIGLVAIAATVNFLS